MKLIDQPHCKKHEVYTQGCIGCRRKAGPKFGTLQEFGTPIELNVISSKEFMKHAGYKPGSTMVTDVAVERPDADTEHLESAKKLLKAIYNDGAAGNRRSLTHDLETLKGLL